MPTGSKTCSECGKRCTVVGLCECGKAGLCDQCRQVEHYSCFEKYFEAWANTMRQKIQAIRKAALVARRTGGNGKSMGGRPQKQYSPIMGRDLNKFLSGIASQQERSVIGHGSRDY